MFILHLLVVFFVEIYIYLIEHDFLNTTLTFQIKLNATIYIDL